MMLHDITVALQENLIPALSSQTSSNPLIFRVGDTGLEPVTSAV
jgi:hypothetical protein